MALEKFDLLEEKVSQLAEKYAQLKREKEGFSATLKEKDKEIAGLQEKNSVLEEEKEAIKNRLDKIISNLESISFNF